MDISAGPMLFPESLVSRKESRKKRKERCGGGGQRDSKLRNQLSVAVLRWKKPQAKKWRHL